MAGQSAQAATNERIVRLLEQIKMELANAKQRDERIARDLTRLLKLR